MAHRIKSKTQSDLQNENIAAEPAVYSVQVFSGNAADGRLQRGDVLVSINNHDVSRMQQKQAEDIIKAAGSALALVVKRYKSGSNYILSYLLHIILIISAINVYYKLNILYRVRSHSIHLSVVGGPIGLYLTVNNFRSKCSGDARNFHL